MERFIIAGYAVLLAFFLDGSRGGTNVDPNYHGHLTISNAHPKYDLVVKQGEIERSHRNIAIKTPAPVK